MKPFTRSLYLGGLSLFTVFASMSLAHAEIMPSSGFLSEVTADDPATQAHAIQQPCGCHTATLQLVHQDGITQVAQQHVASGDHQVAKAQVQHAGFDLFSTGCCGGGGWQDLFKEDPWPFLGMLLALGFSLGMVVRSSWLLFKAWREHNADTEPYHRST